MSKAARLPFPRVKKNRLKCPATPEEFFTTVDTEFGFLVSENGYQRVVPSDQPFTVEYRRGTLCIRVSGVSYGFGACLQFFVDGESLPLWVVMTKLTVRKAELTDKPQLDALREYAWRLRHECSALVAGDFAEVERTREAVREKQRQIEAARQADKRGRFFSIADKLFRAHQFAECVTHLQQSPYELSETWKARFEYAQLHA